MDLNDQQKQAVMFRGAPLLIISGAGTGKTATMASRVASFIEDGIDPERILAITFTNKAAREIKDRISSVVGKKGSMVTATTFHKFGLSIIRSDIDFFKRTKNFSIYDNDDQTRVVKDFPPDVKPVILRHIKNWKNKLIYNEDYAEFIDLYEQRLFEYNALDLDDLVFRAREYLLSPSGRGWTTRFSEVLVDEYQDVNAVQVDVVKAITPTGHISVVGDEAQAIYGFRGSDHTKIINFQDDYPGAKVIMLEKNYRSTTSILNLANTVIGNSLEIRKKNLFSDNGLGTRPVLYVASSDYEESTWVAETTENLIRSGEDPTSIAILYRNNHLSRTFEAMMSRMSIPYTIKGSLRFFERQEIKDAVSFVRICVNSQDASSLMRILKRISIGIGEKTVASWRGENLIEKLSAHKNGGRLATALKKSESLPPAGAIMCFLTDIYSQAIKDEDDARERIDNVHELITVASAFFNKEDFLDHIALVSGTDNAGDGVVLSTIHAAKGLEWNTVFVVGLEKEIIPGSYGEDEEERRLFYVAVTRSKNRLYLSMSKTRFAYNGVKSMTMSPYLKEVENLLERRYQ